MLARLARSVNRTMCFAPTSKQLQEATGADELIITTITHGHADRVHSYQLLADEWEHR